MKHVPLARRLLVALPSWVVFAWSLFLLLRAHLFFLSPPALLHALDEGYVNAFAWRMVDGQMLPFVDGVSHRGPLMYWAIAIAVRLGNPTSWAPIRVTSMICGLLTLAFTFLAGQRAGRPLAGAVGALAVAVIFLLGMPPIDGIAYSGEHLLNVFAMASLVCLIAGLDRARRRPSLALVFSAGALAALGALSKQLGAVAIPTLGLWVLAVAVSRPGLDRRTRWLLPLVFAAGVAIPPAITALRYLASGELKTLYYYTVKYNSDVYLAPYNAKAKIDEYGSWLVKHSELLAILAPIGMWGATRPFAAAVSLRDLPRAYDEHGFVATVAVTSLATALASNAALRDFIHYYIQLVPWCGLLLGALVEHAIEARDPKSVFRASAVRALVLLPVLVLLTVGVGHRYAQYARDRKNKRAFNDLRASPVCNYVRAHSKPGDAIFVWGFVPELYTSCERRPASRYVFTTFVAGFVPWFERASKKDDDARAVPGSRKLLIDDLERSRPPIIVDAPKTLGNRSMRRYEELAAYLDKRYCEARTTDGLDVYRRRTDAGACPAEPK